MKRNFSLKFNLFDIFVSIFVVVILVASIIYTNIFYAGTIKSDDVSVEIHLNNKIVYETKIDDLNDDVTTITLSKDEYPTLLGDIKIIIDKEKGICVDEVTCPNHICEKQGWVNNVGIPITCVPNHVFVILTKEDMSDTPDVVI